MPASPVGGTSSGPGASSQRAPTPGNRALVCRDQTGAGGSADGFQQSQYSGDCVHDAAIEASEVDTRGKLVPVLPAATSQPGCQLLASNT
jgi:hypothetical protein